MPGRVEKKIFKEIMHFHYKTNMAMPSTRTPSSGFNFGRPGLSEICLGVEKKILKK